MDSFRNIGYQILKIWLNSKMAKIPTFDFQYLENYPFLDFLLMTFDQDIMTYIIIKFQSIQQGFLVRFVWSPLLIL